MFEFVLRWFAWGFDASLKAALIAIIVAIVLKLLRASDSNVRHRAWAGVLSGMLLLPLLTPFVPALRLPVLPSPEWLLAWTNQPEAILPEPEPIISAPIAEVVQPIALPAPQPTFPLQAPSFRPTDFPPENFSRAAAIPQPLPSVIESPAPETQPAPEPHVAEPPPPPTPSRPFISRRVLITALTLAIGGTWFFFASILALRLALAVWITARLRRASIAIELSSLNVENTTAKIRECPLIRVPLTVGWLNPHILLPAAWKSWSSDKLHAVLAHEQMHVQRADCLVALLAELNCCVYWFHPLAWWLKQQLSSLAEQACDDAAIGFTGDRTRYARHLLEVAAAVSQHHRRLSPLGVSMARRSNVETRILAILDFTRPLSQRLTWAKTVALAALLVPLITLAAALQPSRSLLPEGTSTEDAQTTEAETTPTKEAATVAPTTDNPPNNTELTLAGTVIDDRGQPVAGANISFGYLHQKPNRDKSSPLAVTNAKGEFQFSKLKSELIGDTDQSGWADAGLIATKDGYGFAISAVQYFETSGQLESGLTDRQREIIEYEYGRKSNTLTIVPDDVPIRGQVLDSEGRPVPGATVEVASIWRGTNNSLDAWYAKIQEPGADQPQADQHLRPLSLSGFTSTGDYGLAASHLLIVPPVKCDADGKFTLHGIGRDRVAELYISGPTIATMTLQTRSRPGPLVRLLERAGHPEGQAQLVHPNDFKCVAAPSVAVTGRVTDHLTGHPLAGYLVRGEKIPTSEVHGGLEAMHIRAMTDADGRYRLEGLPLGENIFQVAPPRDSSHLFSNVELTTKAGMQPPVHDIALVKGINVRGRITDSRTGAPLRGTVCYFAFLNNPALQAAAGFDSPSHHYRTDHDGRYQIPVLAGPGILTFMADNHRDYPRGAGVEQISGPDVDRVNDKLFRTEPYYCNPHNVHVLAPLNPAADATEVTLDLTLTSGATLNGKVRTADGQPLGEYYLYGQQAFAGWHNRRAGETFQIKSYLPAEGRRVMIYHPERNLVGLKDITGEKPGDFEIVLTPGGTITGRILDADGQPLENLMIGSEWGDFQYSDRYSPKVAKTWGELPAALEARNTLTDKNGRFTLPGAIPGLVYSAGADTSTKADGLMMSMYLGRIFDKVTVEPGQTKDLGDLKITPRQPKATPEKNAATASQPASVVHEPTEPEKPPTTASPAPDKEHSKATTSENPTFVYAGTVVDSNGQPVAGASIHIVPQFASLESSKKQSPRLVTKSGNSGRFEFTLEAEEAAKSSGAKILIVAPNYGPEFLPILEAIEQRTLTISLTDDKPIRGRILTLEGQPVADAKITVNSILALKSGDLKPYIDIVKAGNGGNFHFDNSLYEPPHIDPITTDAEGRFQLTGIGSNRVAELKIVSRTVQHALLNVMTVESEPLRPREGRGYSDLEKSRPPVFGATFDWVAKPSRIITGIVVDAKTRQPIANAGISSLGEGHAKTNENGRFELLGCAKAKSYGLLLNADNTQYIGGSARIADAPGFEPIEVTLELTRGTTVKGRIIDQATQQPIDHARLVYFPLSPNDRVVRGIGSSEARAWGAFTQSFSDTNGAFSIAVLPGPGFLGISAPDRSAFQPAVVDAVAFFKKEKVAYGLDAPKGFPKNSLMTANGDGGTGSTPADQYNFVELLNAPEQPELKLTHDIVLVAAKDLAGVVFGPSGQPLTGASVYGLANDYLRDAQTLRTSDFTVTRLATEEKRTLIIRHDTQKLAAQIEVAADSPMPVRVTLQPWGEVTGRLLDTDGTPLANLELHHGGEPKAGETYGRLPGHIATDDQGRFRLTGLVPGLTYSLTAYRVANPPQIRLRLKPGEHHDLGDIKEPYEHLSALTPTADTSAVATAPPTSDIPPAATPSNTPPPLPTNDPSAASLFRGRVVSATGQPVANAKIHWIRYQTSEPTPQPPQLLATTNDAGEFRFPLPKSGTDDSSDPFGWKAYYRLVVTAPGHGFVVTSSEELLRRQTSATGLLGGLMKAVTGKGEPVIKLPAAGEPIRGRLVNIDGQPLPGVTVKIRWFDEIKPPGFSGRVPNAKNDPQAAWFERVNGLLNIIEPFPLRDLLPQATTNTAGQFELRDVGPDRMLQLLAQGEQSEAVDIVVRNQTGENITVPPQPNFRTHEVVVHPRDFVRVIGPSKPFTGRVLDLETSQPIAGAVVHAYAVHGSNLHSSRERQEFATRTDTAGRYKITGLPIGKENRLVAFTLDDIPYVPVGCLADTTRTEDTSHDFRLKRGVWATGRVYDGETDQPFTGQLEYYWFRDRELEKQYPGLLFAKVDELYWTNANGEYKLPVLPTRGILAFRNQGRPGNHEGADRFPRGFGADSIEGSEPLGSLRHFPTMPHYLMAVNYERVAEVNPRPEQTTVRVDLPLFASQPIRIRVVDADGNAVTGCEIYGANERWGWQHKQQAEFVIEDLSPKEHRKVVAFHRGRNLAGGAAVKHGDSQPVVIKLAPAGSLTGRLLDDTGEPITDATLHADYDALHKDATAGIWANHPTQSYNPTNIPVDDQGRFQLDGLIPGWTYTAHAVAARKLNGQLYNNFSIGRVFANVRVEPGEKKDLGNVHAKESDSERAKPEKATPPAKLSIPTRRASEGKPAPTPQMPSTTKNSPPLPLRESRDERASVNNGETRSISGAVHLSGNQPVPQAHVALIGWPMKPRTPTDQYPRAEVIAAAQTDVTGHFQLPLKGATSKTHGIVHLIARADGSAVIWQKLNLDSLPNHIDLKLQPEQPLRVRLIDLEGQPAAGVKLSVATVMTRQTNNEWLEDGIAYDGSDNPAAWLAPPTADQDGRFTIHGLAANHGIWLKTEASDRFSPQDLALNTGMPEERGERDATYRSLVRNAKRGEELVIPISPAQIFEGTIRYEDTKEPVPNTKISIWASQQGMGGSMTSVDGKTDAAGRYHIAANPGIRFGVTAYAPSNSPYLIRRTTEDIRWESGDRIKQVDVNLPRGVLVHGKILATGSQEAIAKAAVQFIPFYSSEPTRFPGVVTGWQGIQLTADDGSYKIAIPPVPGHIVVNHDAGSYVLHEIGDRTLNSGKPGGHRNYANAIHRLDPAADTKSIELNLELEPAATITGRVVDEQGQPINNGSVVSRLHIWSGWLEWHGNGAQSGPIEDGRFELKRLRNGVEYPTHFLDAKRRLGATFNLKSGDKDPTIVLRPCGSATVRFLDDKGQPLADHRPQLEFVLAPGPHRYDNTSRQAGELAAISDHAANVDRLNHGDLKTDADGKLTIPALIPGATYWLITIHEGRWQPAKEIKVEPGQTLDLGDITPPTPTRRVSEGKAASTTQTSNATEKSPPLPLGEGRAEGAATDSPYTYSGTVLDPTGKPLAGAKLHLCYFTREAITDLTPLATTAVDGTFSFSRRRQDFYQHAEDGKPWQSASIVATADGFGFATGPSFTFENTGRLLAELPPDWRKRIEEHYGQRKKILQLVVDQPITGRIVNIDGQPVAGVKISPLEISAPPDDGTLDAWEKAAAQPKANTYELQRLLDHLVNGPRAAVALSIAPSDANGNITIRGLGKDRLAKIQLRGPTIEASNFSIRSRPGPIFKLFRDASDRMGQETFYPSTFTHAAAPSQPVIGQITDAETGQPIPGCAIEGKLYLVGSSGSQVSLIGDIEAVTNESGNYRLEGLPQTTKFPPYLRNVQILPPHGSPYLPSAAQVKIGLAADAVKHDVKLRRGVLVSGQALDSRTGQPVLGTVHYRALPDNPAAKTAPDFVQASIDHYHYQTDSQGRYAIPVLPGKGVLSFAAMDHRDYPSGVGFAEAQAAAGPNATQNFPLISLRHHQVLKVLDLAADAKEATLDFSLKSASTATGRVVTANGQPLKKFLIYGTTPDGGWIEHFGEHIGENFEVKVYEPDEGRRLLIADLDQNLFAIHELHGPVKDIFEVKLSPAAIIKGRLLDADGQPLENITITNPGIPLSSPAMMGAPKPAPADRGVLPSHIEPRKFQTDKDGRFELRGIIPGLKYTAACQGPAKIGGNSMRVFLGNLFTDVTTQPGETKDLGDLKITPDKPQQPKAQTPGKTSSLLAARASDGKAASTPQPSNATEKSPPPLPLGEGRGEGEKAASRTDSLSGRVLSADGKSVAGAKIYWIESRNPDPNPLPPRLVATSDAAGNFSCTLPPSNAENQDEPLASTSRVRLVVIAPGHGFVLTSPSELHRQTAMAAELMGKLKQPMAGNAAPTIRLPSAGDPIRGRLVSIDGQPIVGTTVKIRWFDDATGNRSFRTSGAAPVDEKTAWIDRVNFLMRVIEPVQLRDCLPTATTDASGHFELRDLGANRLFHLLVQSDQAEAKTLVVRNQPGEPIKIPPDLGSRETELVLHPREFVTALGPSQVTTGRVVDRDTGEPIPGAVIRVYKTTAISHFSWSGPLKQFETKTDAQGDFRITGLTKGSNYRLVAFATGDVPYIPISRAADKSELTGPDFRLQRGLWATGRVYDTETNTAFIGEIKYFWFGNEKLEQDPGYYYAHVEGLYWTNAKGEFRVPVLPTRGVLGFHFPWATPTQDGTDRFPDGAGKETIDGHEKIGRLYPFPTLPIGMFAGTFQRLVQISPQPGQTAIHVDLPLTPSPPIQVRVVDAQGRPVAGCEVSGVNDGNWSLRQPAEFSILALPSDERRKVLVFHRQSNLAGGTIVKQGDAQPIEIKLGPAGSVTGRLVDVDGEPITDGLLHVDYDKFTHDDTAGIWANAPNVSSNPTQVPTDEKGRFQLDGLVPGWTYSAYVNAPKRFIGKSVPTFTLGNAFADVTVAPGERKDLGDLIIQKEPAKPASSASKQASAGRQPTEASASTITLSGLVLLPNGQPAAGATVRAAAPLWAMMKPILGENFQSQRSEVKADNAGHFTITFPTQPFGDVSKLNAYWQQLWKKTAIAASLTGYGPAWVEYEDVEAKPQPITLQLVADLPIQGRVIDLEGRPLAGVAIKIGEPRAAENEDLSAWIAGIKAGELPWTIVNKAPRQIESRLAGTPTSVTTDAKGAFEIRGLGRERFVELIVAGEAVAHREITVVTRAMEPIKQQLITPNRREQSSHVQQPVFGAEFTFSAAPARVVEGLVRDAKTLQPLAGVAVESDRLSDYPYSNHRVLKTTTDKDGRFRLLGMPKGPENRLLVLPNDDQPYFMREIDVPDPVGLGPAQIDIDLHRGLWITGRVTDKATGEPVAAARLHYLPLRSNEFAQKLPEFDSGGRVEGDQARYQTKADGTYRLVGLPGPAIVGAQSTLKDYRAGVGFDELKAPKNREDNSPDTYRNPIWVGPKWPDVMKEIDPAARETELTLDFQLDPGQTVQIHVTDDAGNPLSGANLYGEKPADGPWLTIANLGPRETHSAILYHQGKKLGRVITIGPDEISAGKVTAALQPVATISGRVLKDDGSPLSGMAIKPHILPRADFGPTLRTVATDSEGHFTVDLLPGCQYDLTGEGGGLQFIALAKDLTVQAGETKDLGTLKLDKAGKVSLWMP